MRKSIAQVRMSKCALSARYQKNETIKYFSINFFPKFLEKTKVLRNFAQLVPTFVPNEKFLPWIEFYWKNLTKAFANFSLNLSLKLKIFLFKLNKKFNLKQLFWIFILPQTFKNHSFQISVPMKCLNILIFLWKA